MRRRLQYGLVAVLVVAGTVAHGETLRAPWDDAQIAQTDAPYRCPAAPPFAKTLEIGTYYVDPKASVTDSKLLAAYQKASEATMHLSQYAGLAADEYLSTGSREGARCVYSLLEAAAKEDAWTEKMQGFSGVYVQNWLLSGTAMAYLKVRQSGTGTPEQDAAIQHWFRLLADRVREYFDVARSHPGSDGWNNHMYWAGLSVMAEGIADNDRGAFNWGLKAYGYGLAAIRPDGTLDAEMARGQMALHYHLYALGPLIMMAELGEANGVDAYAEDHAAIHRLVTFCVAGLVDPKLLEQRTGVAQLAVVPASGTDIGWAVPYVRRFPNPQLSTMITKAPCVRASQWGGAPPE